MNVYKIEIGNYARKDDDTTTWFEPVVSKLVKSKMNTEEITTIYHKRYEGLQVICTTIDTVETLPEEIRPLDRRLRSDTKFLVNKEVSFKGNKKLLAKHAKLHEIFEKYIDIRCELREDIVEMLQALPYVSYVYTHEVDINTSIPKAIVSSIALDFDELQLSEE